MKFILAVEDKAGRSSLLIADDGTVYTLAEVLDLVKKGQVNGLQVATRNGVSYLRASRRRAGIPALQDVSISSKSILSISGNTAGVFSRAQFRPFWDFYQGQIEKEAAQGKLIVSVDGQPFDTQEHVRALLLPNKDLIFSAAEHFKIDPYLLAAICIDETIRLAPFEEVRDKLLSALDPSYDVSIGIGQVKLTVARDLTKKGYYNPNPSDDNLSKTGIVKISLAHLYPYVIDPKHNVYFAAAHIRDLIDEWKRAVNVDLTPVIIATLYSFKYKKPHLNPLPNARGEQIVNEFMPLTKAIFDGV